VADIRVPAHLLPIHHHLRLILLELGVCDLAFSTPGAPLLDAAEEEETEEDGAEGGAAGDDGDLGGFGEGLVPLVEG